MKSNTEAAAIESVNQAFEAAFGRGDAAGLTAIYTEDGQILPPNSPILSGNKDIHDYWQGAIDSGVKSAMLDTVELDQQGDTAVEVGTYVMHSQEDTIIDEGKYVVIWKKNNGEWKYHRDIWSSSLSQ